VSARRGLAATLVAIALATAARALVPLSPAQRILIESRSGAELRSRLRAHADSVAARATLDAGECWRWLGVSERRAGRPDSAAAAFGRAWALLHDPTDALARAEALLASRATGGVDSALDFVASLPAGALDGGEGQGPEAVLWSAWIRARDGRPGAAHAVVGAVQAALRSPGLPYERRIVWSRRFGPLFDRAKEYDAAWDVLEPLAIATQMQDSTVLRLARDDSGAHVPAGRFDVNTLSSVVRRDMQSSGGLRVLGAKALDLKAADGAPLRVWLLAAEGRHTPLVVLVDSPDPAIAGDADSLFAQLHRAGISVALLDPRGSGGSAGPACSAPDAWIGHEDAMTKLVAGDIAHVVDECLRAAPVDPARVAVGGVGPSALAGALAAAQDARVRALVLVGPQPSPVDRGTFIATIASAGVPTFFQTGPENVADILVVNQIVERLPARQTRVADSRGRGDGTALFRANAAVGKRLTDWLDEAWKQPRPTPPEPRR